MKWIKEQIEWAKSFFSESDGKASNKRLISTGVVLAFLFAYVKTALYNNKIEDIPVTWAMLIIGILGLGTWQGLKGTNDKQV